MRKDNIFQVIKDTPGVSYNEIVRKTNLSNGVVTHYILQLINDGNIEKYGEGRSKYFISTIAEKDKEMISILRNQTNLSIVRLLLELKYPLSSNGICKAINKSASTISVSLKNLQKNSIIEREILKQNVKLTADIGYKIMNDKKVRNLLLKYNFD